MDIQREIFNRELETVGFVSLALLPTVSQLELLACVDPEKDYRYLTSYEIQKILHHMNSHKNIYRRLCKNE